MTLEIVDFMTIEGHGLMRGAFTEKRSKELILFLMVSNNSSANRTNFTVSVDLIGSGCTTGISANKRAKTLRILADKNTKAEDLGCHRPIFPFVASNVSLRVQPGLIETQFN
jgi:3,4-dihydroxy 2-butanone 4-phosphate synthase / GTP cyclohydrolase II